MKRPLISNCICPECGHTFPIPRRMDRQRPKRHIKDLYCPFCGRVQKMLEVREGDYLIERFSGM